MQPQENWVKMPPSDSWFKNAIQSYIDNGFEEKFKARLDRYRTTAWKVRDKHFKFFRAMEDLFLAYTILKDSCPEAIQELIEILQRAEKEDPERFLNDYEMILWTFKPHGALDREGRYTYCLSPVVLSFLIVAYRELRDIAPFNSVKVRDELLDLAERSIFENTMEEHASFMCVDGGRPYDDVSMILAWMVKKGYIEDGPIRPYYD